MDIIITRIVNKIMKARKVYESIDFKRGEDPYDKLKVGEDAFLKTFISEWDIDDGRNGGKVNLGFNIKRVESKYNIEIEYDLIFGEVYFIGDYRNIKKFFEDIKWISEEDGRWEDGKVYPYPN